MNNTSNVERVRLLLRRAFADVKNDTFLDQSEPSHDDCVELRQEMCLLNPPELQWYLPRVLEDLLNTHTNDFIETENAEYVLMLLNVKQYISGVTLNSYTEIFGEANVRDEKEARAFRYELVKNDFDDFTKDQSQAILEWLLFASTWNDYEIFKDDLKGAIDYWTERAFS